ncbi:MAG TPA: endonuclease/exonuclease/phosphatase family protein [Candidatus Saccharimonadales bacterium]|nr:endonuclease/exonuclease/phosphatase family protein [Candidatus Saccharimonadales bacterium]
MDTASIVNNLRCITYNIIADRYTKYIEGDESTRKFEQRYAYLPAHRSDSILDWTVRLPLIIHTVKGYDIICLQEVDIDHTDHITRFLPDYDAVHHIDTSNLKVCKKDKRTNPVGCIILWKKNKFVLNDFVRTSCALIANVSYNDVKFAVCNVHLKAGLYSEFETRVRQISSCIKTLDKYDRAIICGDFNDTLDDSADITNKIISSGFQLFATRDPTCHVYTDEYKSHRYYAFDHVATKKLKVVVDPLPPIGPIPNEDEPSDHIPIKFTVWFPAQ